MSLRNQPARSVRLKFQSPLDKPAPCVSGGRSCLLPDRLEARDGPTASAPRSTLQLAPTHLPIPPKYASGTSGSGGSSLAVCAATFGPELWIAWVTPTAQGWSELWLALWNSNAFPQEDCRVEGALPPGATLATQLPGGRRPAPSVRECRDVCTGVGNSGLGWRPRAKDPGSDPTPSERPQLGLCVPKGTLPEDAVHTCRHFSAHISSPNTRDVSAPLRAWRRLHVSAGHPAPCRTR